MRNPSTFISKYRFFFVLLFAALIIQIPVVSIPFKWLESYFHEISHGLAALVTGGEIIRIELFPNGAGLCTTRGGSHFFISFFGYAGAAIWGVIIYSISSWNQKMAKFLNLFIISLVVLTLIFWVRDLLTLIILLVLLGLLFLKLKLPRLSYVQLSLQITGALILLNSVKSPSYLLDGRSVGDGAALAELTAIPEFIWILLWFIIGISGIYILAKQGSSFKKSK